MTTERVLSATGDLVLVVEDNADLARLIAMTLERRGLRTLLASSGAEARRLLVEHKPDLMLVDYNLPDGRADWLIEQLTSDGHQVPFIVATGHGSESIAVAMMKRGARDYLVKNPAFLQLLPEVVARVLAELAVQHRLQAAEEALKVSEERLRTAMEASGAGIWSWDLVKNQGYYSDRVYELTDLPPGAPPLSLEQTLERMHPDDQAPFFAAIEDHRRTGQTLRCEARVLKGDDFVWLSVIAKTQCDADGRPVRIAGSVVDVSQLKYATEALAASELRFRSLIELAPDGIVVSQDNRIAFVNPAFVKLMGAQGPEELLGLNVFDYLDPEYHEIVKERMQANSAGATVPMLEERFLRLDGQPFEVDVVATGCTFDNRPANLVIVRDITAQKQMRSQAREHRNQLAHALRVQSMGKMVSELAHEINQPLHAISNYASACLQVISARQAVSPEEIEPWIRQIAQQANRAGQIIRHVGEFVRKSPPGRTPVLLGEVLRDLIGLITLDAQAHQARIQLVLDDDPAPVLIDRVQIEQVLVNLVMNGIEAMNLLPPETRRLVISTDYSPGEVRVAVVDRGTGVSAGALPMFFEPFFSTKPNGMGVGLSISRSIIDDHGGRLWATPNPDAGMTFQFTLPINPDNAK